MILIFKIKLNFFRDIRNKNIKNLFKDLKIFHSLNLNCFCQNTS